MKKINYFLILLFSALICLNIAERTWGQVPVYIVSTSPGDSTADTIRIGKWFSVKVEYSGPAVPDTSWCFDLNPLKVPTGDTVGTLYPNRAQLSHGIWEGLCYYELPVPPPPEGSPSIVVEAITVFPPPIGTIRGQSGNGLYVWGGPPKEENQIKVFPNPFGSEKLKLASQGAPPAGQTYITIYPVSGRGYGEVTIKIFDSFGQLVKRFTAAEIIGFKDAGRYFMRVTWYGKNEKGHKVANGIYQICVRVEEDEGPRVYTQKIGVLW